MSGRVCNPPPPSTDGGETELLMGGCISFVECLSRFVGTDQACGVQSGSVSRRILAARCRPQGFSPRF